MGEKLARQTLRTAPFSDSWEGRPCLSNIRPHDPNEVSRNLVQNVILLAE